MKFKGLPGVKFNELPDTESRYLPKEFLSPMVIWVFGNKVAHVIWDSESIFLIDNKQVADDYRNYFKMLWGMGKE
jgi:hypothetical protein